MACSPIPSINVWNRVWEWVWIIILLTSHLYIGCTTNLACLIDSIALVWATIFLNSRSNSQLWTTELAKPEGESTELAKPEGEREREWERGGGRERKDRDLLVEIINRTLSNMWNMLWIGILNFFQKLTSFHSGTSTMILLRSLKHSWE